METRRHAPLGALLSLLLLLVRTTTSASAAPNASAPAAPAAERRGWVPLSVPCPTCRHFAASGPDALPQGAAIVGRALPAPPHFSQQLPFLQQQQQQQPFQQQLLQPPSAFGQQPPPPPSAPADGFLLRPPTAFSADPSASAGIPPPSPPLPPAGQREEVQLLYVPVETLRQRNLQQQIQAQLQTSSPPPLTAPHPTATTTTTTTTPRTTTPTLTTTTLRHRFRGLSLASERSRYLEQPLLSASPSAPAPVVTPAPTPVTTPAPHQPPLSIFVGRHASGRARVGDVIAALRGSRSVAVMDEPGPDAPAVFVGPADLSPPPGFAKFELPYLSAIMAATRGERRVDSLPFFVAPLSFRPPDGYAKIPFPAPHVGSVVIANATFHVPVTTTPAVSLPSDLPPISAELPALVNSLQDSRSTTGDVTLLPTVRNAGQGKRFPQKHQQSFAQDFQQEVRQPVRQHSHAPLQYRQTTALPPFSQQQFVKQQVDYQTQPPAKQQVDYQTQSPTRQQVEYQTQPPTRQQVEYQTQSPARQQVEYQTQSPARQQVEYQTQSPARQQVDYQAQSPTRQQVDYQTKSPARQQVDYQTQPPVTEYYQDAPHVTVENEQTTDLPLSLNTYQQQINQYQQEYLQPVSQQTVQHRPVHQLQQTTPQQHLASQQQQYQSVEDANYAVTEGHLGGDSDEQPLNAGLQTLHAGVVLEQEAAAPETPPPTTTTTTTTTVPPRRQHFRGRQRASSSFANTASTASVTTDFTRRPNHARGRRPVHPSRVRTEDSQVESGGQRTHHRFRGRGQTRQTTTTTTTTSADPTTAAYNPSSEGAQNYDSVGETTPSFHQVHYNIDAETTPVYSQPSYNQPETTPVYQEPVYQSEPESTPSYQQRPAYASVERPAYEETYNPPERKRPSYAAVERAPENQRPAYSSLERNPERQRPSYNSPERVPTPADHQQRLPEFSSEKQTFQAAQETHPASQDAYAAVGESDLHLRATPSQTYPSETPSSEAPAQYQDAASDPYRQPSLGDLYAGTSEKPDINDARDIPAVDNSTPTAEGSSVAPPMEPGTFQRTRGRKGQQVKYQDSGKAFVNDDASGNDNRRPVQVRLRGRVRASRPRPPPEPENYPSNFHDASVFDATRRPAADYSYDTASPLPSTEPAVRTPATRTRAFPSRGSRRPAAAASAAAASVVAAPAPAPEATTPAPGDKVYTVRPARRPQTTPQTRITSVRGRIRRPTTTTATVTTPATTPSTSTSSTTVTAAAEESLPSALAGGFQANEVFQQPSSAGPDYYDYLTSDPAQDGRRPYTASYEDDDPEAGGAESQWTSKWRVQHPNAVATQPTRPAKEHGPLDEFLDFFGDATTAQPPATASQPSATASQPLATASQPSATASQPLATASQPPATASQPLATASQPPATHVGAPGNDTSVLPGKDDSTSDDHIVVFGVPDNITTSVLPENDTALFVLSDNNTSTFGGRNNDTSTLGISEKDSAILGIADNESFESRQPVGASTDPAVPSSASTATERKRRVRVRVRTRVNPRDMLEPAESVHVATRANALPSSPAKAWSVPAPDSHVSPTGAEPAEYQTTTLAPAEEDTTPVPVSTTPEPTTEQPIVTTQIPVQEATSRPEEEDVPTGSGAGVVKPAGITLPPAKDVRKPAEDENDSEFLDDLAAVSARGNSPVEELPSATTESPTSSVVTSEAAAVTTVSPLDVTTASSTAAPAGGLMEEIQRAEGVTRDAQSDATARLLGTSTTTEVSHETEICYRGRCVKTKTQPDAGDPRAP